MTKLRVSRKQKKRYRKSLVGSLIYLLKIEKLKVPMVDKTYIVDMKDLDSYLDQFPKLGDFKDKEFKWKLKDEQ